MTFEFYNKIQGFVQTCEVNFQIFYGLYVFVLIFLAFIL